MPKLESSFLSLGIVADSPDIPDSVSSSHRLPTRPVNPPLACAAGWSGVLGQAGTHGVASGATAIYGDGDPLPDRLLVQGGTLLIGESADTGTSIVDVVAGRALFMHQAGAGCSFLYVGPNGGLSFENDTDASGARLHHEGTLMLMHLDEQMLSLGSLRGSGAVHLGKAVLELGALGEHDVFNGSIADGCQGGGLRKIGPGSLTLGGACLYRGNTRVEAGSLRIDGSLHGSTVVVAPGATLAGGGSIFKRCVIQPGGRLAPASAGRALQLGRLYAQPDALLELQLARRGFGDRIDAGILSLDGARLDLSGMPVAARTPLLGYARLEKRELRIGRLPDGLRRDQLRIEFEDHCAYLVVGQGGLAGCPTPR